MQQMLLALQGLTIQTLPGDGARATAPAINPYLIIQQLLANNQAHLKTIADLEIIATILRIEIQRLQAENILFANEILRLRAQQLPPATAQATSSWDPRLISGGSLQGTPPAAPQGALTIDTSASSSALPLSQPASANASPSLHGPTLLVRSASRESLMSEPGNLSPSSNIGSSRAP